MNQQYSIKLNTGCYSYKISKYLTATQTITVFLVK